MSERFAVLDDLSKVEEISERTRVFEGTGTAFLAVPELIEAERIRIGPMELPLTEKRHYPIDGQQHTQEVEEPLVEVQQRSDGVPVLVRAVISNNGIWPKGGKIYVTAQWGEGPPVVSPGTLNDSSSSSSKTALVYDLDFPGLERNITEKLKANFPNADAVRIASDDSLLKIKGIGASALNEIRKTLR